MSDDTDKIARTIEEIFDLEIRNLKKDLADYDTRRSRHRAYAISARFLAVFLLIVGTIAPLINQFGSVELFGYSILIYGYLCLGLSAAVLVIDQLGLFTEHHITKAKVVVTLSYFLERILIEKTATLGALKDNIAASEVLESATKTVQSFASERAKVISEETDNWGSARRNAQKQLVEDVAAVREQARQELSDRRAEQAAASSMNSAGSLVLAVSYPDGYEGGVTTKVQVAGVDHDPVERKFQKPLKSIAFPELAGGFAFVQLTLDNGEAYEAVTRVAGGEVGKLIVEFE